MKSFLEASFSRDTFFSETYFWSIQFLQLGLYVVETTFNSIQLSQQFVIGSH